jgi:hypothetical protein
MYICNSEKYKYDKGYLHLPITLDTQNLPQTIEVEGTILQLKTSFHVSLMFLKNQPEKTSEKILDLFCNFINHNDVIFEGFTGEFRFAQREEDGRKSLVGMCTVSNLNTFFDMVNEELNLNFQYQPTHVSLYTLTLNEAIGLNSKEELERLSYDVSNKLSQEFIDRIIAN